MTHSRKKKYIYKETPKACIAMVRVWRDGEHKFIPAAKAETRWEVQRKLFSQKLLREKELEDMDQQDYLGG